VKKELGFLGWVRIDDRLIHGQVTVGWRQYLRYGEIWIVDDDVRGEPYLADALQLAAPAGVEVRVMGLDKAVDLLDGTKTGSRAGSESVLMLLRDPAAVLALVERGVILAQVNVGNLGSRPGSVRAIRNVSLTQEQSSVLDALEERGIEVFFQLSPESARVEWPSVKRRMRRR
jgi:mannose/fructose/N-acetylgalactosamine-specific phosphotransferase system component IIB